MKETFYTIGLSFVIGFGAAAGIVMIKTLLGI